MVRIARFAFDHDSNGSPSPVPDAEVDLIETFEESPLAAHIRTMLSRRRRDESPARARSRAERPPTSGRRKDRPDTIGDA